MIHRAKILLIPVALFLAAGTAASQTNSQKTPSRSVIKNVSKDGTVSYSDQPSEGTEIKLSSNSNPLAARKSNDSNSSREVASNVSSTVSTTTPENPVDAQRNKEQCARLKQNISALSYGRVLKFKENGDRYFLNKEQIADAKKSTTEEIKGACK